MGNRTSHASEYAQIGGSFFEKIMANLPLNKKALTIEQQIDVLEKRGLVILDKKQAKHTLKHLNYYRLQSYCLPYTADTITGQFITGTEFTTIIDAYIFDRKLRLLLIDALERIEVATKATLTDSLALKYGAHPHLNPQLFSDNKRYNDLIRILKRNVETSTEKFIIHFKNKYIEPLPPIWALVEILTFGQLSKFYFNLKPSPETKKIAKQFQLTAPVLISLLGHLTTIRNNCAHHSRTWNRTFPIALTKPKKAPQILLDSFNQDTTADHKIYNTLVMISYLMDIINPDHNWKTRFLELMKKQDNQSAMGFPANWQQLDLWQ